MVLLRHSAVYLLARGIPGIVNFIAIALFTRWMSPSQYGDYALTIVGVGLGNSVLFWWIRLGLLRYLPAYRTTERVTFLSSVSLAFWGMVAITSVIGGVGVWLLAPNDLWLCIFGLTLLWVQAYYDLNLELLNAELLPVRYGLTALCRSVVSLVLGSALIYLGWGPRGAVIGLVLGMATSIIPTVCSGWAGVRLHLASRAHIRQLLRYGLPLTLTFAFGFLIYSSGRFLLGIYGGSSATGLYSAAYDLTQQSLYLLMTVVNLAAYPLAVRALEKNGIEAAQEQLSINVTLLLSVSVPATTGLIVLAPHVSEVLLGASFRVQAVQIIPWVALAALLQGLKAFYVDLAFQLGQRTYGQIWPVLGAAIVNISLNIILIPKFEALGSAWAAVASYAVAFLISWRMGQRVFAIPFPKNQLVKIFVATAVMTIPLWLLLTYRGGGWLLIQIVAGTIAYVSAALALNVMALRTHVAPLLVRALRGNRSVS